MERRITARLASVWALAFTLTLVVPLGVTDAHADPLGTWDPANDPCPDVLLIGARGSGQALGGSTLGLGAQVFRYYEYIAERLDIHNLDVAVLANPYPAVEIGIDLAKIFDSAEEGILTTKVLVEGVAELCPDTRQVLVGYSQGAWVTKRGIELVSTARRGHVAAIVLLGDPLFDGKGGGKMFGNPNKSGVLGPVPVPAWAQDRTLSICLIDDVVCEGSELPTHELLYRWATSKVHSEGYFVEGYPKIAAAMVARFMRLEGSAPTGSGVDIALIIDSSGSMTSNDPSRQRVTAGKAYLTASTAADRVGVVDFDSTASILSYGRDPVGEYATLAAALDQIDSSGGTNIGRGLTAGCEVLGSGMQDSKAALFFTDGQGSYSGEDACYSNQGWRVFTFGLGNGVDTALLQGIATRTGGAYRHLRDVNNLVCEFQQIRAQIAGLPPASCTPAGTIASGERVNLVSQVDERQQQVTFTTTWPGSDIVMTLTSPSGRTIDRSTVALDVVSNHGPTFESISVTDPQPGEWRIELFGSDVDPEGEPYTFSTVALPSSNVLPVPRFSVDIEGSRVVVDASDSHDADGSIMAYSWSFGDDDQASGVVAEHNYVESGTFEITLTVVDDSFEQATERTTVEILGGQSAREVRRSMLESLNEMVLAATDRHTVARLNQLVAWLQSSDDDTFWVDTGMFTATGGVEVLELDQRIIAEMRRLADRDPALGPELIAAMDSLIDIDQRVVEDALTALGETGSARSRTKAAAALLESARLQADGDHLRAIRTVTSAWVHTVEARG